MISLQLSALSSFEPTDADYKHLDSIPSRDFTEWLNLPDGQAEVINSIKNFVQERAGSWDKVLALGMGGSALGIVTLKQAFFPFDDRLTVVDNLDSNSIHHLLEGLNPERTLVLVISKSGGTLETMTQYQIFKERYTPELYQKNFIAITDPESGILRDIANQDGLTSFPIPSMVGGRFSVLTSVGLLPIALLGGNIDELLEGAHQMKQRCLEKSASNPALHLALSAYHLNQRTDQQPVTISTLIAYSDQLFSFGQWYQQLLAESIGKSLQVGLTPLALRGASDQHSVLQLMQDGPNDKLNIFLDLVKPTVDVPVPNSTRSVHDILRIEGQGTEQALREDGRPTISIEIPELSEHCLGELFMLFQMQIAILGELFQIDAFNQPGVEKSKKIVKAALE